MIWGSNPGGWEMFFKGEKSITLIAKKDLVQELQWTFRY